MPRRRRRLGRSGGAWVIAALLALLAGCLPIPDLRVELDAGRVGYRVDPASLRPSYERVPGTAAPDTPPRYNRSAVLRYRADEEIDTVAILVPGIFGGAGSFDALARQLVAATPGLEVWTLDRRANLLEDRRGFELAQASDAPMLARDYYLGSETRPATFRQLRPDEVRFMANWGLEVHLLDLHAVVRAARTKADRVLLGGHSLGASMVSLYAAFRLPEGGEGQDLLDGLLLLDGTLGRTGAFERSDVGLRIFGLTLFPSVDDVEAGAFSPYIDLGLGPAGFVRRTVVAHIGALAPEQDAPAGFEPFPLSGRALAGLRFDERYAPVPLFAASVGEARNADYAGNLLAVLLGGLDGLRSRSVIGVAPGAERVEWDSGDPQREPTDLEDYLRGYLQPADFSEWYFPTRLGLEITLVDPALADDPRFIPTRAVRVPTLAFGASRGLVDSLAGFQTYTNLRFGSPVGVYLLPGFSHIDVVTARDNPVVPVVQRWLFGADDRRFR